MYFAESFEFKGEAEEGQTEASARAWVLELRYSKRVYKFTVVRDS